MTTSARASTAAPRTVSSPGSPGPAPTRKTVTVRPVPKLRELVSSSVTNARNFESIEVSGIRSRAEYRRPAGVVEEVAGHGATQRLGVGAGLGVAEDDVAVQRRHQALDDQAVAVQPGEGPGGDVAVAPELLQEGALGSQGPVAGLV